MKTIIVPLATILLGAAVAKEIPSELPALTDEAPASNKPVKVYILSGQSNMFGYAATEGAAPVYPNIYLSAEGGVG